MSKPRVWRATVALWGAPVWVVSYDGRGQYAYFTDDWRDAVAYAVCQRHGYQHVGWGTHDESLADLP